MSDAFNDLGLRSELVQALHALGFDAPSALQRAAIPVLRRGSNAALHASYGAGLTVAYGAAVIDRLADAGGGAGAPRVLVVTPSAARAGDAADELGTLGAVAGVSVRALIPGWQGVESADIVVGALDNIVGSIGRSALKLDVVEVVVIESLSTLLAEGGLEALDDVLSAAPRAAQRIVSFASTDGEVERFIEAHVRKALRIPARRADPGATPAAPRAGEASYMVVMEEAKPDAVGRLLVRSSDENVLVTTRSRRRAEHVARVLAARGHQTGETGALRVQSALEAPPRDARVIAYDVPMDVETLLHLHMGSGVILAAPSELGHLRRIAEEASVTLKPEKARAGDRDIGGPFRNEVRRALQERDLDAQLLLLEPLFDEFSPVEVAAALSALLRERRQQGDAASDSSEHGAPAARAAGVPPAFTRLFISVGSRDNVRPGDLLGAITSEAGVTGNEVGRIELRDTFAVVEVAASVAEKVMKALNGTTMRGRAMRVDYDRRGSGQTRGAGNAAPARGGKPRRPRPEAGG